MKKRERLFELEESLKEVMPEVHRQVKVYLEAKKNGTLRPLPKDNRSMNAEELAEMQRRIDEIEAERKAGKW